MNSLRCALLLLWFICDPGVCLAQKATQQLKDRYFWNLQASLTTDDLIKEGANLTPPERAVLLGRLAAIWWQFDRERSGRWLNDAINLIDSGLETETDSDRRKRISSLRALLVIVTPLDERSSNRLEKLLSSTELRVSNQGDAQYANALVEAALSIVEKDPTRAASLGAASLRIGRSYPFRLSCRVCAIKIKS